MKDGIHWTIISSNMRDKPSLNGKKIVTIPPFEKLDVLDFDFDWAFVNWKNYNGWVYFPLLEEYVDKNNILDSYADVVPIDKNMIPPLYQSGRQYIFVDGKNKVNYNLCGQFCVAYVGNDTIKNFLEKWKIKSPANYNASVIKDKGTGISMVRDMLSIYRNEEEIRDFNSGLRDPIAGVLVSPRRIMEKLSNYDCIVGVKIDSRGNIRSSGIGHWICITEVDPFGVNNGLVTIYNPFPNTYEKVGYDELLASMKNWSGLTGLWVKKDLGVKDVINSSVG